MRRVLILIASCLLFLFAGSATAQAASPHFKKGGEPVCTIVYNADHTSSSTTCHTVLAGLGNEDLLATVTVGGFAKYICENQGGNQAPGQNKVLEGPNSEPTFIPSGDIKNGNLTLDTNAVTLAADATVSASEAGCPNDNWTGVDPVLTVTSIQLVIEQPEGTTIFDCSATNDNGLTSPVTLTC